MIKKFTFLEIFTFLASNNNFRRRCFGGMNKHF